MLRSFAHSFCSWKWFLGPSMIQSLARGTLCTFELECHDCHCPSRGLFVRGHYSCRCDPSSRGHGTFPGPHGVVFHGDQAGLFLDELDTFRLWLYFAVFRALILRDSGYSKSFNVQGIKHFAQSVSTLELCCHNVIP